MSQSKLTPSHTEGLSCSTPLDGVIFSMALELEGVERQLVTRCEGLARAMAHAADQVKAGRHTNSLGEVQSQGMEVDRLCALRDQLANQLKVLKATRDMGDLAQS